MIGLGEYVFLFIWGVVRRFFGIDNIWNIFEILDRNKRDVFLVGRVRIKVGNRSGRLVEFVVIVLCFFVEYRFFFYNYYLISEYLKYVW